MIFQGMVHVNTVHLRWEYDGASLLPSETKLQGSGENTAQTSHIKRPVTLILNITKNTPIAPVCTKCK